MQNRYETVTIKSNQFASSLSLHGPRVPDLAHSRLLEIGRMSQDRAVENGVSRRNFVKTSTAAAAAVSRILRIVFFITHSQG